MKMKKCFVILIDEFRVFTYGLQHFTLTPITRGKKFLQMGVGNQLHLLSNSKNG